MHTLGVIVREHLAQQVEEHCALCLLGVKVGRLGLQKFVDVLKNLLQRLLIVGGEHADFAQLADAARSENREFLTRHEVHNNGTALGAGNQLIQIGLARNG